MNVKLLLNLVLQLVSVVYIQSQTVEGEVYIDHNRNGQWDSNEIGLAGVMVSNQRDVVLTDHRGRYELPVMDPMIIFITKPSGYSLPLNEYFQPQFFYMHHTLGSPKDLRFAGVEPTGPIPESVDFALYESESMEDFQAIIAGDPQPRDLKELGYFRDDVVSEMYDRKASFYMAYGDIVFDDLSIYEEYKQIVGKLEIPAYNVHGNHDMNFHAGHDSLAAETFKRQFGPADYSFNYGKVHFVVLDNVRYSGWDHQNNQKGSYVGYLNQQQLQWLKADLEHTPVDYLVVINTHIPLKTPQSDAGSVNLTNLADLFKVLEKRQYLLAISAHMHYIDHLEFSEQDGWIGNAKFQNINVGATCGAWWSGPKDVRGIPESYCLDGSPNGFYIFSFSGSSFNYKYLPANLPEPNQIRVSFPYGRVNKDSLAGKKILVNIFNADPKAKVYCSIDKGPPQLMRQETMQDPFIIEYLKDSDSFPDWGSQAVSHNHMWSLPLAEVLQTGTHSLLIEATDSKNNSYREFGLFVVD